MAIDWKIVSAGHVERACEVVSARTAARQPTRGLFVVRDERHLPAKEVARVAYLLASGKSPDTELHFASGEATLNLLRQLGFKVDRLGSGKNETATTEK